MNGNWLITLRKFADVKSTFLHVYGWENAKKTYVGIMSPKYGCILSHEKLRLNLIENKGILIWNYL